LLTYYRAYGTGNPVEAGYKIKHLTTYFTGMPLDSIDSQAIAGYVVHRRGQGMAAGSVNVELATLRRALRLAHEHGKLEKVPIIRMLRPAAPRAGFFEREQFEAVAQALPPDLALVARIAYVFGWRLRSEVLTLTRSSIDLEAGTLYIEPGRAKNRAARLVFLTPQLKADIADQLTRVRALEREMGSVSQWLFVHLQCPFRGKRIRDFDRRWRRVCREGWLCGNVQA
jgi:integrase